MISFRSSATATAFWGFFQNYAINAPTPAIAEFSWNYVQHGALEKTFT